MLTNSYMKWLNGNIAPLAAAVIFAILATIIGVFWMSMEMVDTVTTESEEWRDQGEETKDDLVEAVAGFGLAIVLIAVLYLWKGKAPKGAQTTQKGVFVS